MSKSMHAMRFIERIFGALRTKTMEPDVEKHRFLQRATYSFIPSHTATTPNETISSQVKTQRILLFNGFIFVTAVILLVLSLLGESSIELGNGVLKKTNAYSPIFDILDIPLVTKKMNATLFDSDPQSIFRQGPSPEVDEAWDTIVQAHTIIVNASVIAAIGKDPTKVVRYPEDFGYGPDAYISQLDVFHQLHCINTLRKAIYPEYYMKDKPITHQYNIHNYHCLHILLQDLMCTANVDVYTYNWVEGQSKPFPDFNMYHKCRDFDAILDWHRKNRVHTEMYKIIHPAKGQYMYSNESGDDLPGMGIDLSGLHPNTLEVY